MEDKVAAVYGSPGDGQLQVLRVITGCNPFMVQEGFLKFPNGWLRMVECPKSAEGIIPELECRPCQFRVMRSTDNSAQWLKLAGWGFAPCWWRIRN